MGNVIVLVGPTASGKTAVSIELAREISGEIISADSIQVYRYMDIGTAKPDIKERAGIEHYLLDEIDPDQEFSVAKYQELALHYIERVHQKGKLPIVVGGTGLYISSLVNNIQFSETICDQELRERLKKEAADKGNEFLHQRLAEIDPEAARKIHVNDLKRIIRAIEVFEHTHQPISYHQEISRMHPPSHHFYLFGLRVEREKLYERINKRVDRMLEEGLIDEVRSLMERGYHKNMVSMQGLGYKEVMAYLKNEMTLDEMVYLLKRDTRHYAKRQITWFKRMENIQWIDLDESHDIQAAAKKIKDCIATYGII